MRIRGILYLCRMIKNGPIKRNTQTKTQSDYYGRRYQIQTRREDVANVSGGLQLRR